MTQQDMFLSMTADDQAEAEEAEFFRTPRHTTLELLHTACAIPQDNGTENGLPGGEWVDVGAGDGAIWSVCRDERPDVRIVAVELRPVALAQSSMLHGAKRVKRFLGGDWTDEADKRMRRPQATVVVMNSAFSLTVDFVTAAFRNCPKAWVWSLQRQSWGAQKKARRQWLLDHWPEYKLQCGRRPSFTGDGKTDPAEYIWYGWSPTGRDRKYARFEGPCLEHPQQLGLMATETT